jgi:hypothetical protein
MDNELQLRYAQKRMQLSVSDVCSSCPVSNKIRIYQHILIKLPKFNFLQFHFAVLELRVERQKQTAKLIGAFSQPVFTKASNMSHNSKNFVSIGPINLVSYHHRSLSLTGWFSTKGYLITSYI